MGLAARLGHLGGNPQRGAMPPRRRGPARRRNRPADVFLNIPYDDKFQRLFLAYIAGLSAFGLIPRATLELGGSARRLDRILHLMQRCTFAWSPACPLERFPKSSVWISAKPAMEKYGRTNAGMFLRESEKYDPVRVACPPKCY